MAGNAVIPGLNPDGTISWQSYSWGELLAALRKDLQFDATTDIQAGTVLASLIDRNGKSNFLQLMSIGAVGLVAGYIDGRSSPPGELWGFGFTPTKTGTGAYTITFTTAFSSFPAVGTATGILGNNIVRVPSIGTGSIGFQAITLGGAAVDEFVGFIAVGPR